MQGTSDILQVQSCSTYLSLLNLEKREGASALTESPDKYNKYLPKLTFLKCLDMQGLPSLEQGFSALYIGSIASNNAI